MRRVITFLAVTALTAGGALYWLYDGDLDRAARAVEPAITEWNADLLAQDAGVPVDAPASPAPISPPDEAETP